MLSVGAAFQVVFLGVLLPGQAAVGSNASDVSAQWQSGTVQSRIWLRRANVGATIDGIGYIQVVVAHGVSADSSNVLRQSSIDNCAGSWPGSRITADPR